MDEQTKLLVDRIIDLGLSFFPGDRRSALKYINEHLQPFGISFNLSSLEAFKPIQPAPLFNTTTLLIIGGIILFVVLRK